MCPLVLNLMICPLATSLGWITASKVLASEVGAPSRFCLEKAPQWVEGGEST